jgi:hypothetical protein
MGKHLIELIEETATPPAGLSADGFDQGSCGVGRQFFDLRHAVER